MSKESIRIFLEEMSEQHDEDIEAVELPDGTKEYVLERIAQGTPTRLCLCSSSAI